jgi:hypothetical protein
MCVVEGAEYGLQRIFVWRGTIITGARFRCRTLRRPGPWPAARRAGAGCAALRYLRARPPGPSGCPPVAAGAAENLLTQRYRRYN